MAASRVLAEALAAAGDATGARAAAEAAAAAAYATEQVSERAAADALLARSPSSTDPPRGRRRLTVALRHRRAELA